MPCPHDWVWERPKFGKVEQSFCVRLGLTRPPAQLRKASAREHDWQVSLRATVQCGDQRRQLVFLHVLQLVNEHHRRGVPSLGREPNGFQQCGEILFKVTVVGESCFGVEVEADFDIGVLDFKALAKPASARRPR